MNQALFAPSAPALPSYLAIEVLDGVVDDRQAEPPRLEAAERLQVLTPRLMHWHAGVWILDLGLCLSYWQAVAERQKLELLTLLRQLLPHDAEWRGALTDHPWSALLLLATMRERGLLGLLNGGDPLGARLFQDVSWTSWQEQAALLLPRLPRRRQSVWQGQSRQLQRAMTRLGVAKPWQLRQATPASIQRRFGATMRDLWSWAYGPTAPISTISTVSADIARQERAAAAPKSCPPSPFDNGFPWLSFVATPPPGVQRHCESVVGEWEHLEAWLREDCDRLCRLAVWQPDERVVSLEWRLILSDTSHHAIPISFRHPHSLHAEFGLHQTTLLQARYAFAAHQRSATAAAAAGHPPPAIAGWELMITERLRTPGRSIGLFGDQETLLESTRPSAAGKAEHGAHGGDWLRLQQLENKLALRLSAFSLCRDWVPEDSFRRQLSAAEADHRPDDDSDDNDDHNNGMDLDAALLGAAALRPLYLYEQPRVYSGRGQSLLWRFLERTAGKWWRQPCPPTNSPASPPTSSPASSTPDAPAERPHPGGTPPPQRDYYRLTDAEGRMWWVYKAERGHCIVHGVFA